MKRLIFGLLALLPLAGHVDLHAGDVFTPSSNCGFGFPGNGVTRQHQAFLQGEELQLLRKVSYTVCEMRTKTVRYDENGEQKDKAVAYTVCVPQVSEETRSEKLDRVKAFTLDRKRIPADRLASLLAEPRTVLVCNHDQKVDGTYLKLVQPGTIVIMLPPPVYAAPMPPSGPTEPIGDTPPAPPAPAEIAAPLPAPPAPVATPAPPPAPVAVPKAVPAAAPIAVPAQPAENAPAEEQPVAAEGTSEPLQAGHGHHAGPQKSFAEPLAALAVRTAEGQIRLRRTTAQTARSFVERESVAADGQTVLSKSPLNYSARIENSVECEAELVRGFTSKGEPVAADELAERLAKETPVLVSADGLEVNADYLKIIRDDALILVMPVEQPVMAMPPAPAPADEAPVPVPSA